PPRLTTNSFTACFPTTLKTLELLADSLNTPFLGVISTTAQSLLENFEGVKHNRNECTLLMEQTHELLVAIIIAHIKSDARGGLPMNVVSHIGKLTETLQKIHAFVEAQQTDSKIKRFFRQGEINTLLKDCKAGLEQGLDFFQINTVTLVKDITEMHRESQERQQGVLDMIEALSDASSDQASSIIGFYSRSHNSSNSISMLPSEPKILHGRDRELSDVLKLFHQRTPRITILGAGGMGKTSLVQAVVHHPEIAARYGQLRFFVPCDSVATKTELATLIGAHVGLKPSKDLTRLIVNHFAHSPPALLILDNFETLWEPTESRGDIEEFLSLLTDVKHLALMITMRGAERPAKVSWSRPFLQPLAPLEHSAALQTFLEITDHSADEREVDKVLSLTDNMPLAIDLLAHLADAEGCSNVLARWEQEKTIMISDGYDRRSNLDLSISLSLSSPRIKMVPGAQELLSLLSVLPDGLSDVELVQSKLSMPNILSCKAALIRTALAYSDNQKRLRALVPIREYVYRIKPPGDHLVQPLLQHFQELLELYREFRGTQSNSGIVTQISSNYANILNVISNQLQPGHSDFIKNIYCACHLNNFSGVTGRGRIPFMALIHKILPEAHDARLEAYVITELFSSWVH
ncbi:P-loop containing nucleoside triphosphate hydrolase protein, partial [Mycena olivaceomarginata]